MGAFSVVLYLDSPAVRDSDIPNLLRNMACRIEMGDPDGALFDSRGRKVGSWGIA